MNTPVKKISKDNADLIRAIWAHTQKNADSIVKEYGIDLKLFRTYLVKTHGKTYSSLRKKGFGVPSCTRKMVEKFTGVGDGVSVDDLLAEMDD